MGKEYISELKLEVALIALKEELTTAEISQKYGVSRSVINTWRREALEHLRSTFDKGSTTQKRIDESEEKIAKLERKIGQLTMDNEFLKKNYKKYYMK